MMSVESPKTNSSDGQKPLNSSRLTLILTNIALIALAASGYFWFGDLGSALAYLRGDRILPYPLVQRIGNLPEGQSKSMRFLIRNLGDREVHILGAKPSCDCIVADRMPLQLAPGTEKPVEIIFQGNSKPGAISERLILFTDLPSQRNIILKVVGRVNETDGSAGSDTDKKESR